jgi:hypothetical protein
MRAEQFVGRASQKVATDLLNVDWHVRCRLNRINVDQRFRARANQAYDLGQIVECAQRIACAAHRHEPGSRREQITQRLQLQSSG